MKKILLTCIVMFGFWLQSQGVNLCADSMALKSPPADSTVLKVTIGADKMGGDEEEEDLGDDYDDHGFGNICAPGSSWNSFFRMCVFHDDAVIYCPLCGPFCLCQIDFNFCEGCGRPDNNCCCDNFCLFCRGSGCSVCNSSPPLPPEPPNPPEPPEPPNPPNPPTPPEPPEPPDDPECEGDECADCGKFKSVSQGEDCEMCDCPPTITITRSGGTTTTLMDPYNLNVSISLPSFNYTSVTFQISNNQGTYELQSGMSLSYNEPTKRPGRYTIKAIVDGTHESDEIEFEVQFPDVSTIRNNSVVQAEMNSAWQQTKNDASPSGRREHGFWILVNTNTGSYEINHSIPGPFVSCGTHAEITFSNSGELPSSNPLEGGKYVVAFFHTHTPLTYCPNDRRPVGPTPEDRNLSYSLGGGLPGFVYDYIGGLIEIEPGKWVIGILGGHGINANAEVYPPFGPTRRASFSF